MDNNPQIILKIKEKLEREEEEKEDPEGCALPSESYKTRD